MSFKRSDEQMISPLRHEDTRSTRLRAAWCLCVLVANGVSNRPGPRSLLLTHCFAGLVMVNAEVV